MFERIRELVFSVTGVLIVLVLLSSFLLASYEMDSWPFGDRRTFREQYSFHRVGRRNLEPFLSAPGRVESSRRTLIKCELERMSGTTTSGSATGASTILWVIPEGSTVKKGDLLASLDGSSYEEMLRQQEIVVEQAQASHYQAQLDNEIAKIALQQYLEGTVQQSIQDMKANIAMADSTVNQARERLDWTKKMNSKGYASVAQMETDKQAVMTADWSVQKLRASYDLFERFTLPKTKMTLQADITTTQTTLDSEQVKLNRQVERFDLLKKQVERCSIRAPHDGVVFYYFNPRPRPDDENSAIEPGLPVRQEQKLFFLPDLTEMEIQVILNESIVRRVESGMRATVEFEALPQVRIPGTVVSVSQIPNQTNSRGEDVRFFQGELKLDHSAPGLKPGMSALVTFELPHREGVVVVPHDAVSTDVDKEVCFVVKGDHLERRVIQLGTATTDLVEIAGGLTEGEEIVLDPPGHATRPGGLAGFDSRPWPKMAPAQKTDPSQAGPRGRGGFGGGPGSGPGGQGGFGGAPGSGPGGQGAYGGGQRRKGGAGGGGANRKSRKTTVDDE